MNILRLIKPSVSFTWLSTTCLIKSLFHLLGFQRANDNNPFSVYGRLVHEIAQFSDGDSGHEWFDKHIRQHADHAVFRELRLEFDDSYRGMQWRAVGVIDMAADTGNGIVLYDWKTGKSYDELQATFYAYLVGNVLGVDNVDFCFVSPTAETCRQINTKGAAIVIRNKIHDKLKRIKDLALNMDLLDWDTIADVRSCYFCQYRHICPIHTDWRYASTRVEALENMTKLAASSVKRIEKIKELPNSGAEGGNYVFL